MRDPRGVDETDLAKCYETNADALLRFAASQVGPTEAEDVLSTAVLNVLRYNRQPTTEMIVNDLPDGQVPTPDATGQEHEPEVSLNHDETAITSDRVSEIR